MRKYVCVLLMALGLPAAQAADGPPSAVLASTLAAAQAPAAGPVLGSEVTLPQLLELVRNNSPALQAERTQVAMAEADLMTAQTFSNPSIAYTHKRGERETTISQDLPIFGQRGARIDSARSGVDAARAQLRLVYAQALQDAARDFMSLLVAQEREKRWIDARDDLESAFRIVQGQVQAGARSRYDLTRLELERASLDAQLARSQAETLQAAAQVAADVGAPAWRPRAAGSIVARWDALNFDAIWPQAQNRLPVVRAALAQQEFAEKQLQAEKRQAYPTPTFMVGRLNNSNDGRSTEYGVSVGIPLFDRNQGPIARAAAEADGMRLRSRAIVLAAEGELRRATEQLNRRQQLAERFEKEGLSMIPRLRQMAQDSYTLGRGSILELVDAIQAIAEKKNAYLDLMEAALQAEVDVRIASGELGADLLD
ncbi:Cobalt-zinc-cadmium resistance protein CzcC precursor [Pigmentiphaga humi]|uniref:Cobalt-zinc-cadmium resistance protein CzcC n=1 Tax=Pigmentiphaga humi TaxID=2478468 RepID=A0A3P4B7Y7_9BURK|nr:TolC family protein [Pigmentiphaga humi]VCU71275.1 Cobalt-zinc-cadmium resistance protein CzcC precursor [Pigmentiphaga humi]